MGVLAGTERKHASHDCPHEQPEPASLAERARSPHLFRWKPTFAEPSDLAWSRRMYVFSAVEAIAFAAVGWLFGKEVHREQAHAAEKRAADAESRADTANAETRKQAQATTVYEERARAR
jgi:hypothetical protein